MSYACALIGISYIFMHMHYCTSLGTLDVYVWTWSTRCWSRPTRRCSTDIARRWKDLLKQPKTRPKVGRAQGFDSINTNLVLPPGKPRCMTYYFKLWLTICIYYLCITFQELFETLVAWSLGSLELILVDRSIVMLCLIVLGRSRVISCHSRDIGCLEVE